MNHSFECPVCYRLQEELYIAVDRLAVASGLLANIPRSGEHHKFEPLLAASKAAKAECVRISAEKDEHEATHLPWLCRKT